MTLSSLSPSRNPPPRSLPSGRRQYVYFAYRCKYTTLNVYEGKDPSKDFWTLWDRDVVEIFLNPQPEHMQHYYEFEVAPNNLWIDLEIDLDKKPFDDAQVGFRVRARDAH